MSTLRMLIELEYDGELMHGDDPDAVYWFKDTLQSEKDGEENIWHNNLIGDSVGKIKVLEFIDG